jgi:hypothetical protein
MIASLLALAYPDEYLDGALLQRIQLRNSALLILEGGLRASCHSETSWLASARVAASIPGESSLAIKPICAAS